MRCRERLEKYLRENQVPFQVQHHPRVYTAQEVAASEHIPGRMMAKTVMVLAKGQLEMVVLPASYRVDLAKVGAALGSEDVRLAHEGEFANTFPDCEVGAEPPFGNLWDVPVYVDRSLTQDESIVFRAGTHTDTLSVAYADFERLIQPTVADLAQHE